MEKINIEFLTRFKSRYLFERDVSFEVLVNNEIVFEIDASKRNENKFFSFQFVVIFMILTCVLPVMIILYCIKFHKGREVRNLKSEGIEISERDFEPNGEYEEDE